MKVQKHTHFKKLLLSIALFSGLTGFTIKSYALTEKLEVNLFTCPISSSQRHERIVIKDVTVNEANGSYQYFVLDVEAGNQNGAYNGEGQHLKYIQTLLTSQNALRDTFYRTYGDHFLFEMDFGGHARDSVIKMYLDKTNNGKYILSLNGNGPLFYELSKDYQDVLLESEFYSYHTRVECFIHPDVNSYVTK